MLLCAMLKKFIATVAEVELNCTLRNGFCKWSRDVFARYKVCYNGAMICATCLAMALQDKLHEILHSVTER